jgi:cAMP-dependent protein kinase regulator
VGFLQRVPILQTLSPEEVLTVADALQTEEFPAGHVIVEEGASKADRFYIVEKVPSRARKV